MEHRQSIRPAHLSFARLRVGDAHLTASITALFQDRIGFVWIGTQGGLMRFDGHEGQWIRSVDNPRYDLPGKYIGALAEDESGALWIGTFDGGCTVFDTVNDRIRAIDLRLSNDQDRVVRCFQPLDDGRMMVGTHSSLTVVDPASGSVSKFVHPDVDDPFVFDTNRFTSIMRLDDRLVLVGSSGGLFLFDTRDGTFRHIPFDEGGRLKKTQHGIVSIVGVGDDIVAATTHQIYRLDRSREVLELIDPMVNHPSHGTGFHIRALAPDSEEGRLWIGADTGLLRLESDGSGFTHYRPDESDPRSLIGAAVHVLRRDRSGMLWIGTFDGVSMLDLRYNFRYHRIRGDNEPRTRASSIVQDERGTFWIGTPHGLSALDPSDGTVTTYSLGGSSEYGRSRSDYIRQIHKGSRHLWIASYGGLFQWDMRERRLVASYVAEKTTAPGETGNAILGTHVQAIVEDDEGYIWSGCDSYGMQRLDPDSGTFRYYRHGAPGSGDIPSDMLFASYKDRRGRLWFGFIAGLARYDRGSDSFETFLHDPDDEASLGNNMVMDLCEDAEGGLWIGTAGGLNRVVEEADGTVRFVRYGIREGLPDEFIGSMIEADGALWLGTDRGIVRFREADGEIDARLYDVSDGLHIQEYYHRSVCRDSEGWLNFGGHDGFDRFHPGRIRPDTTPPVVVLTGLRLFNRPVPVTPMPDREGDAFALDRSITHLRELRLTYRQSVVTFEYAALHYRQPEKIRYAYRLEGFDRDWIDAGRKVEATYTNLDPGEYLLRVGAANSDGVWSRQPVALVIRVEPPPWRTRWAYAAYSLAGAGAIVAFTKWRVGIRERELRERQRVVRAREEERESIRRQNASDFHDEAGTTLTRILFLSELARRHDQGKGSPELRGLLEKIDENASRLSQGMRDFIWVLDPDKDTLLDTVQRIGSVGESLFMMLDTTFTMRYDHRQMQGVTLGLNQRRQTLMICKEALHNAARHSGAASVVVDVILDDRCLIVIVADDGRGFLPSENADGYGMKSMRTRAGSVDGELTIESRPGVGTRVVLRIPHLGD